ncbi:Histone-lysine N-methyltransferase ASHR1 [Zea mays]|uniref:Histone-lysine N-methyltransferase ASHR1 n=1 Tax=Zea mays TaxID=4577 RepID=A0A1D6GJT6_MAIZE|nr:Histone-lysine N-methyltransferase ASHR1 [Zea mays]
MEEDKNSQRGPRGKGKEKRTTLACLYLRKETSGFLCAGGRMASWLEQLQRELAARGLTVASIPGKGRGLIATCTFFPGDVILNQEPYASTPNKILVGSSCDHCFTSGNLRKCSMCRVTWYCSSNCQVLAKPTLYSTYISIDCAIKEEWKLHQLECRAMAALTEDRKKMLTPTIRLMVRLALKRKLQNEKMANLVSLILPFIELDLKEIAQTFSKHELLILTYMQFACNAHTICDPELRPLGTGLYPVISIINHSCVPNAVLIFDGRTAYVRALQPINKDEEVSISYIETATVTKKRNNDLKQYFFTCTCPRCVKGFDEDALLEGFRCKNQACDGFLLPNSGKKAYTCQKCGASRDVEEIKNMRSEILQLSDKASSFLSSGSILIYLELQDWWTALTYCRLTIPVYERVYPPFHPMIGLQFYTCGKLEWLLEFTEDALKSLTRAADILKVTHGVKSQFMKELFGKLEEARAEVSFRLSSRHGHDE